MVQRLFFTTGRSITKKYIFHFFSVMNDLELDCVEQVSFVKIYMEPQTFIWSCDYIYHVSIQNNKNEIFVLSSYTKAQLNQKIIDNANVVFGVAVWFICYKCVTPQYTCNIIVNYTPSYIVYRWQHIILSESTIRNMFSKNISSDKRLPVQ